jgi:hypothetical protein
VSAASPTNRYCITNVGQLADSLRLYQGLIALLMAGGGAVTYGDLRQGRARVDLDAHEYDGGTMSQRASSGEEFRSTS